MQIAFADGHAKRAKRSERETDSQATCAIGLRRASIDGRSFSCDGRRLHVQGVTYGPFAANATGEPLPSAERVRADFLAMRGAQINAIRTYHVPPRWLLEIAEETGVRVFIDVPWRKHLCFLDSPAAQREARQAVSDAAQLGAGYSSVLAYSIGNEVPSDIVRWHGARRVQRFLRELADVVRQADPVGLVTYASYPPTEYLELPFLDFATFNVYLHDRETFRRYMLRLQNLIGDRPLLLGELGMDTLRNGDEHQAQFLASHVAEARRMGVAGSFVFSWTDEWHTGGHPIHDWAFGITRADRTPKPSYHALGEVYRRSPAELLSETPRVSVVVCSYNGARTLEQCLQSLARIDYPDYEVILVDDGSTDDTRDICSRFPAVRTIHQSNQGLSAARNVGMQAATGEIVAYTDSDCFVSDDWLTYLVHQLQRTGAAAVGGPNLTPEDGRLAACVAVSPGQPTHVLESDQVAEHIPGCNMAFRRGALLAINGFDPQYRKAGDDVDVCWRLQQAGMWITFAPAAFVWHHRRQGPKSYLRQQAGYGEAEALLRFQHPERFNRRGEGKWRGVLYGAGLSGLRLGEAIIYRGTFGTGMFQCVYQPAASHWAMLPSTLEWHAAAVACAVSAIVWQPAAFAAGLMFALSLLVAALQAWQAKLPPAHEGLSSRLLVATLCYMQPLVRSWARYRTRWFARPETDVELDSTTGGALRLGLSGRRLISYWSESGVDRTELLDRAVSYLSQKRWSKVIDSGWADWDLQVRCSSSSMVQVKTSQENHGSGKRLIHVRYRLRLREFTWALGAAGVVMAMLAGAAGWQWGAVAIPALVSAFLWVWVSGVRSAGRVLSTLDCLAAGLQLVRCDNCSTDADQPEEAAVDITDEELVLWNGRAEIA